MRTYDGMVALEQARSFAPPNEYPERVRHEWRMMAEMRVRMPDVSARELSKTLGFSYHTILSWSRNPAYQRYENFLITKKLDEIPPSMRPEKTVDQVFSEYEVDLAQRLVDIIETTSDEKLAASIAQDILDRRGYAPKHKDSGRPIVINIGNDVLQMFQRRAEESGLTLDGHSFPERTG